MKNPTFDRLRAAPLNNHGLRAYRNNRGFVVIASLLILVVLTLIQLAMARSFWAEEIMGGNTREKARALNAAQSANRFAELWVTSNRSTGTTCGIAGSITAKVCTDAVPLDNSPTSATVSAFKTWSDLLVANASAYWGATDRISSTGATANTSDIYYKRPGFYIQFINGSADGQATYYKISAFGYGGNGNAVAVTQSLFQIDFTTNASGNKVTNLGGL